MVVLLDPDIVIMAEFLMDVLPDPDSHWYFPCLPQLYSTRGPPAPWPSGRLTSPPPRGNTSGTALLHHCIIVSLHHCITVSLHQGITASLYHCYTSSLYHCAIASLHHCFTSSLNHCVTESLHHCITVSLHHSLSLCSCTRHETRPAQGLLVRLDLLPAPAPAPPVLLLLIPTPGDTIGHIKF